MASTSIHAANSPGDAATSSRRLASILLDQQQPYFIDSRNATTATAKSMGGHTMAVSFWIADPPDMSFFSVHCTKPPNSKTKHADFTVFPRVVGAEGPFVLLRAQFKSRYGKDEYFMYKAGDREWPSPSLEWVPSPYDEDDDDGSLRKPSEFGIVLCGFGGGYLLAALCDTPSDYQLQIYSSERKTWSTTTLPNPCPPLTIVPEKVIKLGEGLLGWVDFSHGLLVRDLNQDPPVARFIPLPEPFPENRDKLKASRPGASARSFRDLTCVNGVLKFIEMEHRLKEKPIDPSDKEFLYDSDLIMSLERRNMDEKHKSRDGWRAMTWIRTVSSNCWSKGCAVDVDDILDDEATHSALLSGLRGQSVGKLKFRDVYSAFPTLSTDGDDLLYLKSVVQPGDRKGWVVAIDLGNKTVKALGAYSFEGHNLSKQAFRPCTLFRHLNRTPGTEVSACSKIRKEDGSANDPDNTPIGLDGPSSCKSRGKPQPPWALAEINCARNEAQSIVQNDHISRAH